MTAVPRQGDSKCFEMSAFQLTIHSGPVTPADLIKLFEHLLIIARLSSTEYFMPSLLQMITSKEVSKQLPPPSFSAAHLLVHFPTGCTQNGVFCGLVVYLISVSGWKFAKGTPNCSSCNCVCFQLPDKQVVLR